MSLPQEKLDEIISELDSLNPEELEQIAVMIRKFKIVTNSRQKKKPSDFRGIWSHLDINVEQECNKMRKEWDRNTL